MIVQLSRDLTKKYFLGLKKLIRLPQQKREIKAAKILKRSVSTINFHGNTILKFANSVTKYLVFYETNICYIYSMTIKNAIVSFLLGT